MNIRWNRELSRFEAEFSKDFNGDLDAVKTVKFHTDGAPQWVWWVKSLTSLNKLRKNKPASGLTITPEAFQVYQVLNQQHEASEEIKKQFKQVNKQAVRQRQPDWLPVGKEFLTREDLPPKATVFEMPVSKTPTPDLKCIECNSPVYFYEYPEIPMCSWCDKTVLEKL